MENALGYSSSEWLPYVGLDFDDLNGVNLAIGWSGNWKAEFEINGAFFRASMGTRKTKFYLTPGESVIQPSILFMKRRETSVADAQNIWRKFILEHKTPKGKDGKPYITPMVASASGYAPSDTFLKAARLVKEQDIGAELLGVDAGWYGGDHTAKSASGFGDWVAKAGDWRLNTKRHPQGLKKISDAAHDAGMVFSLWCEIERVMPDAPLYSEKNEYIIVRPDNRRATLNLGDKAAWKYAFDTLSDLFAKHGVDVWRIDSNCRTDAGTAWKILDEKNPDRIGVAKAKYVEGFYRLWDELKRKFPHMQFDNCASGGKRLDYESLSRSFTVWRSDTQCHQDDEVAESNQIQNYYLHMWLPSHSGGNGAKIEDTYKYVSSISSGMMVPAGLIAIDKHNGKAKKLFALAKRMRKYFVRDFYQLSAQPETGAPIRRTTPI